MPTKHFSLESDNPERLVISWDQNIYGTCTIRLDNNIISTLPNKELLSGKTVHLPDASILYMKLTGITGMQVLRDGKPLLGSDPDRPFYVVGYTFFLYVMAGLIGLGGIGIGIQMLIGTNGYVAGLLIIVISPVIALGCFLIARGLWRLKNWARMSMIVVLCLGVLILGSPSFRGKLL